MATTVASLEVEIDADVNGLAAGMDTAERKVDGFAGKAQPAFNNVKNAIIAVGAATGAMTLGRDMINTAIEFESAWVGVEKVVDATEAELDRLQGTLREMATDSDNPLSSLEDSFITLAGIAEIGGQLGIAAEDLDDFVQVVGELTMATNLSGDEAATFLGKFSAVTGLPVSKFRDLGDAIVTLGNNFAVTEDQLAQWGLRLAPLSAFDWSPDEILAYGTAMETVGLSPELGGTNLTKTVTDFTAAIATGRPELEKYASIAGMTVDELKNLEETDPQGAFNAFLQGLSEMDVDDQIQAMEDLNINSTEQRGTLLRLAGTYDTVLTPALDTAAQAFEGNNALMEEAEKRADTTEGAINRFSNVWDDFMANLGGLVLPVLTPIVDAASDFIGSFERIPTAINIVLDEIGRGFKAMLLDIEMRIGIFLDSVNKATANTAFATNFNVNPQATMDAIADIEIVDQLNKELNKQIAAGEGFNLADMFYFTASSGVSFGGDIGFLIDSAIDEDNVSAKFKDTLSRAITSAIQSEDLTNAELLLDAAIDLDLPDIAELTQLFEDTFGGGGADVESDVSVTPTVTNTPDVVNDVETAIEAENYSTDIQSDTAAQGVVVNLPGFVQQVLQQLQSQDFSTSISVPVTVTPEYTVDTSGTGGSGGSKLKDIMTDNKGSGGQDGAPPPPPSGSGQSGNAPPPVVNINVQGTMMGEDDLLDAVNKAAKKAGLK